MPQENQTNCKKRKCSESFKNSFIRSHLLVLPCAFLVTGCAMAPNYWVKDGATQQDFDRDIASCRMQAARIEYEPKDAALTRGYYQRAGSDLQDAATLGQFMNDCLTANGWHLRR